MAPRPASILILAVVYLLVGVGASVVHAADLRGFPLDAVEAEAVSLLAIVAGIFLFLGRNWARWLALAWIVFHVILSAFHNLRELAIHALFCLIIAWLLFRPPAERYFGPRTQAP